MERRLAAILAADVVSFSSLMTEDESGTLHDLQVHRKNLFFPKVEQYKGRLVKLMGDGALVEFTSVMDAVQCAVDIQTQIKAEKSTLKLRIGIHLGDVIVDGDDVYGNGVNLAARLEGCAKVGGV
ncbi:adenylate/guanylate cyclase domain-containing protein, partial [Tateyamaria sp.]